MQDSLEKQTIITKREESLIFNTIIFTPKNFFEIIFRRRLNLEYFLFVSFILF